MKLAWGAVITVLAAAGTTLAQPVDPPGPPDSPPGEAINQAADPAVLKERLHRRIEEMRRHIERTEAALRALDEGAPPERVMNELGGPPPGRDGPPGPDAPMTRQDREQIREFIRENFPAVWERLQAAERGSPQRAERLLTTMRPRLAELMDLKRRDETLFRLKLEDTRSFMGALEAARELRQLRARGAGEPDIAAAEAKVRALIAASVDAQLKYKAHELEALGGRIEELRKELDGLRADRESIIDQRTQRLTAGREGEDRPGRERFRGGRPPRGDEPPR